MTEKERDKILHGLNSCGFIVGELAKSINEVMRLWQKEQEAR